MTTLTLADLKPGLYRIKEDSPNPQSDKRVNRDWRFMPLRAGSVLMCVVRDDHDRTRESMLGKCAQILLAPTGFGTHLPGAQYQNSHAVLMGWRWLDGKHVSANDVLGPRLLDLIEPMPVTTVDEALLMLNAGVGTEISWRDIALQLLHDTGAQTSVIFARTQERLTQQWAKDDEATTQAQAGEMFETLDTEFSQKAYRP